MNKDEILDMVLEYGQMRAAVGEAYEMVRTAHTMADQSTFRKTAENLSKEADWYYLRIKSLLGK